MTRTNTFLLGLFSGIVADRLLQYGIFTLGNIGLTWIFHALGLQ